MKVILSVPDEGDSRNASCTLNLISTLFIFNPIEVCSNVPCIFIYREDELFPDNFVICLVDQ
jgi:hypothetical protein